MHPPRGLPRAAQWQASRDLDMLVQMHCVYTPNPNPDPNPKSSSSTLHGRHSEDHQNVLPPSPPAWPELVSISSSSDERCNSSAEAVVATAEAMMEEAEAKAEAEVKCCRTTFKC